MTNDITFITGVLNAEKCVDKRGASRVFFTQFVVF